LIGIVFFDRFIFPTEFASHNINFGVNIGISRGGSKGGLGGLKPHLSKINGYPVRLPPFLGRKNKEEGEEEEEKEDSPSSLPG
jgi:hypothetical protein